MNLMSSWHSSACLLLLLLCIGAFSSTQAQSLGSLLMTAEERARLDELRQQYMREQAGGFDVDQQSLSSQVDNTPPAAILFQLSGILERSDGSRIIWLNGEALTAENLPDGFSLTPDGRALQIVNRNERYTLYPGQTIDLQDGSRREAFQAERSGQARDEGNAQAP